MFRNLFNHSKKHKPGYSLGAVLAIGAVLALVAISLFAYYRGPATDDVSGELSGNLRGVTRLEREDESGREEELVIGDQIASRERESGIEEVRIREEVREIEEIPTPIDDNLVDEKFVDEDEFVEDREEFVDEDEFVDDGGAAGGSDAGGSDGTHIVADANANASFSTYTVGVDDSIHLNTNPLSISTGDTMVMTFPNRMDVSGVHAAVNGAFSSCSSSGQVVTCTSGIASASAFSFNILGIHSSYNGTDHISNFEVRNGGNPNSVSAADADVPLTESKAANAGATVLMKSEYVNGQNTNTLTRIEFNLWPDLVSSDTVDIVFPPHLDVSGVKFNSQNFGGNGTFSCASTGELVTCTVTNGTVSAKIKGEMILEGIVIKYGSTDKITSFEVEKGGVASQDIATDSDVSINYTTVADANASVILAPHTAVGAVSSTQVDFTLPVNLASTDTVKITFPAHVDVSSATIFSTGFSGSGLFSCSATGQVVTCTTNGPLNAGTGFIVMNGIFNAYAATTDITSFEVRQGSNPANLIATDSVVPLSDAIAADANASVVVTPYTAVGAIGNTNAHFTLPVNLASTDTVKITFPAHVDVSGTTIYSTAFGGPGTFTCTAAGQVVICTANGTISAGTGDIVMKGIINASAGTTDITNFEVRQSGNPANLIATDSVVPLSDAIAKN